MPIFFGEEQTPMHFAEGVGGKRYYMCGMSGGSRLRAVATITLLLVSACSYGRPKVDGDAMPKRDINAVMEAHTNELMAIPGVTGVAIGALDNGTPCILVLVVKETGELDRKIPKKLEGHPVRIFESGVIKPMDSK
jgi:hypothetical protein